MTDLASATATVAAPLAPAEDDVRRMLYRVTRTLANANRQLGRRADIEALVSQSWQLLGLMPDGVLTLPANAPR